MPIRGNILERTAFRLNLAPAIMTDYLGAQAFQTFTAAHRLGVFRALGERSLTAGELAAELRADQQGTTVLLRALEALGYVEKRDSRFSASPATKQWLPVLAEGLPLFQLLVSRMADVDEAVRHGGPKIDARCWLNERPGGWRDFQAGMVAFARMSLAEVVTRLKLPKNAARLLDIGGGPGVHSLALCERHPKLHATVFDLPEALDVARERIAAEHMEARVVVRPGDFWKDDLGSGYDVALLFNIIHGIQADKNIELLAKTARALAPGGTIAILDQLADPISGPTAKAFAALNGLTLFNIAGGQSYSFAEVSGWLREVGFQRPRRIRLLSAPGCWLLSAQVGRA